ncbi:MAG: hypothetical protein AB8G22_14610 [Saprospiraceae bacterium]
MYYPVLTLLLICLSCQFLYCQNHHYRQYTIDDGLPTNYVYGVREDDRGYIWAYTENGLAKFDGERFHIFTTADGLPSNDVYHFEKDDSTGLLWIMTTANVPAYLEGDSIVPLWEYADKGRGQIHKINGKIRNRDYFVEGKGFNLTDSVFTEKKIGDRIFINYNSQDSVSFGYIQNERRSKFIGSFKYNLPKDQYQIYDWPAAVSSSFNSNNLFTFSNVNPFFVLDSGYYLYSFQPETNERLVFDLNAVTGQKVKGLSVEFPAHNK